MTEYFGTCAVWYNIEATNCKKVRGLFCWTKSKHFLEHMQGRSSMKKATAKECRQLARVLLKDWRYWQRCRTDEKVRVVREYYEQWGETHMCASASTTEYRTDYLNETWAWFDNPAAARRFCVKYLGLPAVEQAESTHTY